MELLKFPSGQDKWVETKNISFKKMKAMVELAHKTLKCVFKGTYKCPK